MKKEKQPFFEQISFNNEEEAKQYCADCRNKLERGKIGLIVAAIVPVVDILLSTLFNRLGISDVSVAVIFIAPIIAYIVGGGLKSALKFVFKVTRVGWIIIPIFPIDIAIAIIVFCISGGVAIFLPIIFVFLAQHQLKMNMQGAQAYLNPSDVAQNMKTDGSNENADKICPNCEAVVKSGVKFCMSCGTRLE